MIQCKEFDFISSEEKSNLVFNSKKLFDFTLDVMKVHDNGTSGLVYKKYFNENLKKLTEEYTFNLNVKAEDIVLSNLIYDMLLGTLGCSTIAFFDSIKNKPAIYRNMDWIPAPLVSRATTILSLKDGKHVGVYGQIGVVSAVSNRDFGLCLNAVNAGKTNFNGYPVLLFLRKVMDEAENYKEAKSMLCKETLMSGALITLIGSKKEEICVIERSHSDFNLRNVVNGFVATTNHYQVNNSEFCSRLNFINENFEKYQDNLFELLSNKNVKQDITSQQMNICNKEIIAYVPKDVYNSKNLIGLKTIKDIVR